jgi:hypothetical protein
LLQGGNQVNEHDAIARIKRLSHSINCADEIAEVIERLINERDEARRMWCEAEAVGNCLSVDDMKRRARAEAKRREWDCFKEDGK